jgi:hypothetical protein
VFEPERGLVAGHRKNVDRAVIGSTLASCVPLVLGTFFATWHFDNHLHGKPRELAMATQIIMDHNGDSRYQFDANDLKSLLEAEHRFKELTGAGFTAATRNKAGEPVVTRVFDPGAEETLFFPRLVGG